MKEKRTAGDNRRNKTGLILLYVGIAVVLLVTATLFGGRAVVRSQTVKIPEPFTFFGLEGEIVVQGRTWETIVMDAQVKPAKAMTAYCELLASDKYGMKVVRSFPYTTGKGGTTTLEIPNDRAFVQLLAAIFRDVPRANVEVTWQEKEDGTGWQVIVRREYGCEYIPAEVYTWPEEDRPS